MKKHSGFVSIIGRPNVGKSTLLNRLVGEKLAGVSPKPQTTRDVIRGILTRPEGQIVFLDTPGLHEPRDLLTKHMVREAEKTFQDADLLYLMVLPTEPHPEERKILESLRPLKRSVLLVVNQVDRYPKPHILPVLDHYRKACDFKDLIPLSAKTGEQVPLLLQRTFELLPEAEPFFPEDQISDQSERSIVGEILREKLYLLTQKEIPYATAVVVESFKEREGNLVAIEATIVVEKDSQKGILVGKGGGKAKEIGTAARLDIERFLGKKVFLRLWVKTIPHWKKDRAALRRLGYG